MPNGWTFATTSFESGIRHQVGWKCRGSPTGLGLFYWISIYWLLFSPLAHFSLNSVPDWGICFRSRLYRGRCFGGTLIGRCVTEGHEPRQIRKEAAISDIICVADRSRSESVPYAPRSAGFLCTPSPLQIFKYPDLYNLFVLDMGSNGLIFPLNLIMALFKLLSTYALKNTLPGDRIGRQRRTFNENRHSGTWSR